MLTPTANTIMTQNTFKFCFLVPCYNHGKSLEQVVHNLAQFNLDCLIIDDGNDQKNQIILQTLADKYNFVQLFRLAKNSGKGAAVKEGFAQAVKLNFTHVIQIDADGQHDITAVSYMLKVAKQYPDFIISGRPIYDVSVPKHRLISRYITHFWVYLETLSFTLKDTMCGFRCYPLNSIYKLCQTKKIGNRMEFDIEIMVKAYWLNIKTKFIPVKVIYPQGGHSNFNLITDNLRISWMHTKLFCGMLWNLPQLLKRKFQSTSQPWYQEPEKKGYWGIKLLFLTYSLFGRWPFKLLALPAVSFFYLTGKTQRRSSKQYLNNITIYANKHRIELKHNLSSFKHFWHFADILLDKLSAWNQTIKLTNVKIIGVENYQQYLEKNSKGIMLLASHLGNIELCRALAQFNRAFKINVLVFTENAARFNRILTEINPKSTVNFIQVIDMSADLAIILKQKIDRGEWIAILGDRTPVKLSNAQVKPRVSQVNFFDKPAYLPQGPYILAHVLECPVVLMFGLKPTNQVEIYIEKFADLIKLSRNKREQEIQAYAQKYADSLAKYCIKSPLDWFNFYNFWKLK